MLEVLAWMVVPASAESPFRSSVRERDFRLCRFCACVVRFDALFSRSGNIMASCYAHLSLSLCRSGDRCIVTYSSA